MSNTEVFEPSHDPNRGNLEIPPDPIELDPPKDLELEAPKSLKQTIIMYVMFGVMGAMVVAMLAMRGGMGGGSASPMIFMTMIPMVMMVVMMVMNMARSSGQEGGNPAEMVKDWMLYSLAINKTRDKAHAIGRVQHHNQCNLYPNATAMPAAMASHSPAFWSADPTESGDTATMSLEGDDTIGADDSNGYMTARIGVGIVELAQPITFQGNPNKMPETQDPVHTLQAAQFKTAQGVVMETPIAHSLDHSAYGMRGPNVEARYRLSRSMILSLAYGHSPTVVNLGVICPKDRKSEWEWMKWLPHNADVYDPTNDTSHGFPELYWDDIDVAMRDLADYAALAGSNGRRIVVFVDMPSSEVGVPASLAEHPAVGLNDNGTAKINNVTFVVVRAGADNRLTDPNHRFFIDNDSRVISATQPVPVRVDDVSVADATFVARCMSGYRTPDFGQVTSGSSGDDTPTYRSRKPITMLEALGIEDIDEVNLRALWNSNEDNNHLEIPLGFQVDASNQPTGEVVTLNLEDKAHGGSGVHGAFSGGTGTGKSFLLQAMVLMLCYKYSPRRLNFIAADFKGNSTFRDMGHLPHFVANISNLGDSADMVARLDKVIQGEIQRRQEIFNKYGVADLVQYRSKQREEIKRHGRTDMMDMPDLIIIADEFREFITKNPQFKKLFESVGAVGRSLGIQLLLTSQFIDSQIIGEVKQHLNYGISLKVASPSHSVEVLGTADAASLPTARVALVKKIENFQDTVIERFQGFDHSLTYIPPKRQRTIMVDGVEVVDDVDNPSESSVPDVTEFALTAKTIHAAGDTSPAAEVAVVEETAEAEEAPVARKDHFHTLLDKVTETARPYADKVYQMWPTPMGVPMSFADVPSKEWEATSESSFRIGDIDLPYDHKRIPLKVSFEGGQSNICIVGQRGSGLSMTLKTMIAGSAMSYTGRHIAWMVYDYTGSGMRTMETWPNVSAVASRDNRDGWTRIRGEVEKVMALRRDVFASQGFTSLSEYLAYRDANNLSGTDPYGHIALAIDGFTTMYDDFRKSDREDDIRFLDLVRDNGAALGIHLVLTLTDASGYKITDYSKSASVTNTIILKNDHTAATATTTTQELRDALGMVPGGDPGRGLIGHDTSRGVREYRDIRIAVPVGRHITPIRDGNNGPEYDRQANYNGDIRDLGSRIAAHHDPSTHAPKLNSAGFNVAFDDIISRVTLDPSVPAYTKTLPMGISLATDTVFSHDLSTASHLVVSGQKGSGTTTFMRTHMEAVMQAFTPDQARMVILDGGQDLFATAREMQDRGYCSASNYAMSMQEAAPIFDRLRTIVESYTPTSEMLQTLSVAEINKRPWVTGAELFVYIDGLKRFDSGYDTKLGKITQLMAHGRDIGVHFIISELPDVFLNNMSMGNNTLGRLVDEMRGQVVFMGGTGHGAFRSTHRFRTMERGRARFLNDQGEEMVQIAQPVEPQ